MKAIPQTYLTRIEHIIKSHNLFADGHAYIAYSGGKDSFFLCLSLVELGYTVHPIIIDIGYGISWERAILNVKKLDLNPEVINMDVIICDYPNISSSIQTYYNEILQIQDGKYPKSSPCTPCHNAKMTILSQWAKINNVVQIATGHHGTDASSSLLKSFFMYLDRWEKGHDTFSPYSFNEIIKEYEQFFLTSEYVFIRSHIYKELERQIESMNIGTDEAILQRVGQSDLNICRPLYDILEVEIFDYFKASNAIFGETECFSTNIRSKNQLTPREMVQYNLLRKAPISIQKRLLDLNYKCLDSKGYLNFNVRNNRHIILGPSYKSEAINLSKM